MPGTISGPAIVSCSAGPASRHPHTTEMTKLIPYRQPASEISSASARHELISVCQSQLIEYSKTTHFSVFTVMSVTRVSFDGTKIAKVFGDIAPLSSL